jgi:hypothetical protein
MVSVEEIDYIPEFTEEIREETGIAARRFHKVLPRARAMAERKHVELHPHVLAGTRYVTSSSSLIAVSIWFRAARVRSNTRHFTAYSISFERSPFFIPHPVPMEPVELCRRYGVFLVNS